MGAGAVLAAVGPPGVRQDDARAVPTERARHAAVLVVELEARAAPAHGGEGPGETAEVRRAHLPDHRDEVLEDEMVSLVGPVGLERSEEHAVKLGVFLSNMKSRQLTADKLQALADLRLEWAAG